MLSLFSFPALSSSSYLSLFGLEIAHKSSRVWHPAQPSPFLNSQTSLLLCVDHVPTVLISSPPPPSPGTSTLEIISRRGYMNFSVPCLEVEPSLGPPSSRGSVEWSFICFKLVLSVGSFAGRGRHCSQLCRNEGSSAVTYSSGPGSRVRQAPSYEDEQKHHSIDSECFQDLEPQDSLLQSAFTSTKDFMKVPHIPCPPSAYTEQDLALWLKDQPL